MKKIVFLFCGLLLTFSGCIAPLKVEPIDNVTITRVSKRNMSTIIRAAALEKGWAAKEIAPNVVRCTLNSRSHEVVVDVPYTDNSFSIHYVSSKDMDYDEKTNTIHRKYVQWVRNLEKQILIEAVR